MHLVSSRKSSERVSSASLRGPARTVVQTGGFTHSTRLRVSTPSRSFRGFTIVELLVVIVIIAILAAITILAYGGVTQKAVASSLQSDLSNAATAIKAFEVDNGNYPSTISTNCSTTPDSPTNKCLKLTPGNIYIGYSANNTPSSKSFLLIASNKATTGSGSIAYKVTNSTAPTQLATTSQPNTTPGAVLELHAARANGGTSQGLNDPLTTTWADTSGNGNNGTLTNFGGQTPWSADRLTFDGSNDWITLPDIGGSESDEFTYEAIVYLSEAVSAVAVSECSSPTIVTLGTNNSGYLYARVRSQTSADSAIVGDISIVDGGLHHIALVGGGGQYRLYLDGSSHGGIASIPSGGLAVTSTGVGRRTVPYSATPWKGSILVARIYPFALTADQVAANYAAGPTW